MIENKVTTGQFFSLTYISTVVASFMFVSTSVIDLGRTDAILFPLIYVLLSLIAAIPIFAFFKRSNGKSVLETLNEHNRIFSIVISVIYAVGVFVLLLKTLARLDLFTSSEIFPENSMTFLIVLIVIVSTILSMLGLAPLARASTIFVVAVIASVSIIVASAVGNFNSLNFTPLFTDGIGEFLKQGLAYSMFFPEFSILLFFLSNIKGNVKKSFFIFMGCLFVSLTIVTFTGVGALGEFSNTQLFPAFAISSVGEFNVLERFESISSSVWTLCIVAKTTLQIIVVSSCIKNIFPKINSKLPNLIVGTVTCGFVIYISQGVTRFSFMSSQISVTVMYLVLVVLLPLLSLIGTLFKKRGEVNENRKV